MTESDYDFIDAILSVRRIDTAATTTISLPETDTGAPYFPETPTAFRDTLFASAATEMLAILAGGVPQSLTHFLRRDLPPCDIPSLLRQLRYTLLEHQFQTWVTRNEAQPVRDHKPSYVRPKRPPNSPPKAQPNPQRKKKRKRRSKEDAWNQQRNFWKRSRFFFTKTPQSRHNATRSREEAASPPNARKRRRYDPGGDGEVRRILIFVTTDPHTLYHTIDRRSLHFLFLYILTRFTISNQYYFTVLMLVIAWRKLERGSIKCSPPVNILQVWHL